MVVAAVEGRGRRERKREKEEEEEEERKKQRDTALCRLLLREQFTPLQKRRNKIFVALVAQLINTKI